MKTKFLLPILTLLIFLIFFLPKTGLAYYTTTDNGDLLNAGDYRAIVETNVVFNDMNGLNLLGKFDFGFNNDSNFRALIGAGAVGFQSGLLYKWVPIPDFKNQPAIGLLGGFIFARDEGVNFLNFRLHPFVSKQFETSYGIFTPYSSLPFGTTLSKGKTYYPLQFVVGTEWKPNGLKYMSFFSEVGFNLHESFGYVSLAAALRFNEEGGISVE